ncbi:MAG: PAS domain-containing sensor histidine kinase [Lutibacter sp.]
MNTERRYKELEMRRDDHLLGDDNRFKQLIKNSFDMIILLDSNGVQHFVSESCEKILGYKQEELIKISTIEQMIHPDDKESTIKGFLDIIENKTRDGIQYRHRHKNGGWVYLETFGTNQLDNPAIKSVILNVRDITERKKAEERLESNYSLLRIAGKTAKFGGWSYDVTDKKLLWSDEIAAIREEPRGFSPDLNSGIAAYAPEFRDRISKAFKDCVELGIPYDEEMMIATAKGNNIWIRTTGEAVRDDHGNIVKLHGSFQNINLKKLREQELKESENQLKELNATKDKLFTIIAHDLRSPFNTILGFSDLLANNIENYDSEKIAKFNAQINSAAANTLVLLDNLLDWAKSQTGQIKFKPVKLNLQPIIERIIEVLNPTAELKNITLSYIQFDRIEVYADQYMLKIILRNLIANAIKFTNSKGSIKVNALKKNNFIEITVSDNGIGMSKKTLNKLFSIQTNETTLGTANEIGSGLGLILCKEFIEKQGGKIWVESEIGKGSDFKFTLPLNS